MTRAKVTYKLHDNLRDTARAHLIRLNNGIAVAQGLLKQPTPADCRWRADDLRDRIANVDSWLFSLGVREYYPQLWYALVLTVSKAKEMANALESTARLLAEQELALPKRGWPQ